MATPASPLPSGRREPKGSEPQPRPRVDWHDASMPGPLLIVSDSTSAPARGRKTYSGGVMTSRLIPGRIELIYSPARTSARAHPPFRGRFSSFRAVSAASRDTLGVDIKASARTTWREATGNYRGTVQ